MHFVKKKKFWYLFGRLLLENSISHDRFLLRIFKYFRSSLKWRIAVNWYILPYCENRTIIIKDKLTIEHLGAQQTIASAQLRKCTHNLQVIRNIF